MILLRIVEFAAGLVLAGATLRDVFQTVVVPGPSRARLRVARRVVFAILPLARRMSGRSGLSTVFAPTTLVATFAIWMALLILGFGLMGYAMREFFDPPTSSLPQALYVAGSALVTIGLSETDATGPARWLTLAGGFCGLGVMTMAVTYLLEVQSAVGARDVGVLKLTTTAGRPPSGVRLLERYGELGCREHVVVVLEQGRDWCARVQQSHAAHPSLIYFRSVGAGSGWPASLAAVMDAALLLQIAADPPAGARGAAALLLDQGMQLTEAMMATVGLDPESEATPAEEVERAWARVRAAGYDLPGDGGLERFLAGRAAYIGRVRALADHLAAPGPALVPEGR